METLCGLYSFLAGIFQNQGRGHGLQIPQSYKETLNQSRDNNEQL